MKTTKQKIHAYKLADAKQHLYLIPVANGIVVLYYLVVGIDHPAFLYSCLTLLGSLILLKMADLDRLSVILQALVAYAILVVLELTISGLPSLNINLRPYNYDVPGKGVMLVGLIAIMPFVYLGVKVVMAWVLVRVLYLVNK